jgi:amino acid adenylation domain-containing protein/thioester reductase-like protein
LGVLQAELGALLQGQSLKPLESDFGQSAARESAYLNGSECAQDKGHWSRVLGALSEAAFDEAPLDYPRSANAKAGCHRLQARLSPAVGQALNRLARKNNASLHALAMALVALEARRRFGKDEMIIGTPADMRDNLAESSVIGCYVNMLPLPLFHQRGQSFQALLQHTQQALASALAHGRYPFARIYHDFWSDHPLPRHPSRYPLFDLAVTEVPIVQQQNASLQFHPLKGESLGISYEKVQNSPGQDMVLNHESLSDGGLVLQWQVNSAVYGKETAEAWLHAFLSWAEWLAEDISRAEAPVPALLPQEAALLRRWEYGEAVDRPVVRAHELFEATLDGGLDQRPALITRTYSLSYRQLEEEANILAHAVLSRQIGRGDVVGVISGRSANLPAAALAVWKAGATYLPLAADLPPERLAYMMEDAGAKLVLVLDQHPLAPSCPCLRPEDLSKQFRQDHRYRPGLAGNCSDIAYIIYTSGSTGRPKGTLISHGAYVNFVLGAAESLGLNAHDRCLTFSSPSFDVSLSDMGVPLAIGAAMCPLPQDILNSPTQFLEFLTDLEITAADMTPTYLRLFDGADLGKLRVLVTGGEPPFAAEIQKYSGHLRYFNAYGPTENTITSAMGLVSADCAGQPSCGRPLPNTSIHICDPDGNPVPPGVIGEVWLGGAGLAKGYLGRPDLTAASFVDTPQGCRYRTGDLGRWILDGELEILGRIDTQVKLRGQRVELGEIESVLENHPSVKQAIAVIHAPEGSQPILWAFACLHTGNDAPHQAEWHAYLSRSLPSYMVPASVIKIDVVPTNSSGKVDLKALLAGLTEADAHAAQSRTPPRTATEQRIAQIWAEQFNGRTISREDGFFELGGDSLRAIAVVSQLRREFHCAINDLYEHPVLADFALCCHPREDHLRMVLEKAKAHWCAYHDDLANYEALRDRELGRLQRQYELKSQDLLSQNLTVRRNYDCVLITGATGYVGSYLLRELCRDSQRRITALVRGKDVTAARARLGAVLCDYFGADTGEALLNDPRLTVLAGDLRRDDLGLASADYEQLSTTMRAIFHCAANVNHYGHYSEFHQTNVVATERLLKLAAGCSQGPADFHLISTTSVVPKPPEQSFHLFTEFDSVPDEPNSNYYIRTKQEAERRVVAARSYLSNACIHRIGNVVFASDGTTLQRNIKDNAFFRQVAAYCQLGAVPDDSHVWMCHVDIIGKAVLALAETACLVNETHHLEHSRRDFLADIVMPTATRICSFGEFLARLSQAIDEPDMQVAFAETMGNYKLYRGLSPQPQFRRLELTAQRTNRILEKLGLFWPDLPTDGQTRLLQEALQLFRQ